MDSIRAMLIERLTRRIDQLKKSQRRLRERHLEDQLLDRTLARLVRIRDLHLGIGQAEKTAQRTNEFE